MTDLYRGNRPSSSLTSSSLSSSHSEGSGEWRSRQGEQPIQFLNKLQLWDLAKGDLDRENLSCMVRSPGHGSHGQSRIQGEQTIQFLNKLQLQQGISQSVTYAGEPQWSAVTARHPERWDLDRGNSSCLCCAARDPERRHVNRGRRWTLQLQQGILRWVPYAGEPQRSPVTARHPERWDVDRGEPERLPQANAYISSRTLGIVLALSS